MTRAEASRESNDLIRDGEVLLKKVNDEVKLQELEKRDKVRLLEYLQQATKDKQVELRVESDELRERYAELNKTRSQNPHFPEEEAWDELSSLEEQSLSSRLLELENRIETLLQYTRPVYQQGYMPQYLYQSQHTRTRESHPCGMPISYSQFPKPYDIFPLQTPEHAVK